MTSLPSNRPSPWAKGEVAEFLDQLRAAVPVRTAGERGRLILALDATASREPTWDRACHVQGAMFEATAALGGLEIQLAYYRGFSECKASRWMTSADELHRVMRSIGCLGGHTQIQRLLEHTIHQARARKVNALVFVGDAMEEKADDLCALAGELGSLATPVFMLQEGDLLDATATFKQIAKLSGGAHLGFSLDAIGQLKELLGAVAVYAAGGRDALLAHAKKQGGEVLRLTSQLGR